MTVKQMEKVFYNPCWSNKPHIFWTLLFYFIQWTIWQYGKKQVCRWCPLPFCIAMGNFGHNTSM